jgi:hypothetical protein
MDTISSDEFEKAVMLDPSWALKVTKPLRVDGACNMKGTAIEHLSPLLHFAGKTDFQFPPCFAQCKKLKKAEGHFTQWLDLVESGIEEVGDLTIDEKHGTGVVCDLGGTPLLKKDPIKAATTMAGSPDIKVWESIVRRLDGDGAWRQCREGFMRAIKMKTNQMVVERLHKTGGPLEI